MYLEASLSTVLLIFGLQAQLREGKNRFSPSLRYARRPKKCFIRCSQRLHDTSNHIKIWFSFDLRYFRKIKYDTNPCNLLKTELVRYGLFLYKFNLYRFYWFSSIVRLWNYHKTKVNKILMRFNVFWSVFKYRIIDFWPSGTTWEGKNRFSPSLRYARRPKNVL